MHTLVVKMTTDPARSEEVSRHLREDVTAWAKRQPGFVSGEWLLSDTQQTGLGLVSFDSAEAASSAAVGPRSGGHDDQRAWNIDSVTVYGQVASA
ncbi:MAG: hypothetical protein ABIQ09_04455 [Jatrophihabitantaceae bacterium]